MPTNTEVLLDALLLDITPNTNTLYVDDTIQPQYEALISLVKERLGGEPDKEDMLEKYRDDPAVWESVLIDALTDANVIDDPEVQEYARELLSVMEPLEPEEDLADHPEALKPPSSIPGIIDDFE